MMVHASRPGARRRRSILSRAFSGSRTPSSRSSATLAAAPSAVRKARPALGRRWPRSLRGSPGRPCKVRLDRDDDFALTGKRHDFRADWKVGYDDRGVVAGYEVMLNARCGCSADLSPRRLRPAMFHAGNGYWLPDVAIATKRLKTNTVSNTAFRGLGGPQGMLGNRAGDGRDRARTRA